MAKGSHILLVLILALTFVAGCAPTPQPPAAPTSVTTEEAAQPAPTEAAATEAAAAEAVSEDLAAYTDANINWKQFEGQEVTVGVVGFGDTDVLKEQIPQFEELTGIQVDYQVYPEAEWNQKSVVDMSSTAGTFDILLADFMLLPQYAEAGFVEKLEPYISNPDLTDPEWFDTEDIFPALQQAGQVDGEYWGIPLSQESTLLYYRKDLLEQAGLTPPQTMDELMAAAEALNNDEVAGIAMRGLRGQGLNIYVWSGFFRAFGGQFFNDFPMDMAPAVNSPEGIEATDFYATILSQYGPAGVANWDWAEVLAAQQTGKVAMAIDASDFGFQIDDPAKSETAGKWGYALVPEGPAGRYPSVFSFLFTINADSDAKEASWLFLEWASSKPTVKDRAMQTGTSVRESAWNDPNLEENLQYIGDGQWMSMLAESLSIASADYRPRFPHWREMGDRLGIAVQSVIAGEKDAETAMNEAQSDIETLLKEAGYIE
jgi:ABC-type glycerol-3-phosphate transport system substrate-binding protein